MTSGERTPDDIDMGPLPDLVGYALRRAQVSVFQDFYATFSPADLRPAEFSVLLVIHHNPGLRQGQAAEVLGIQPPNFGALLGRLVTRGLADRRRSQIDGRAMALFLTPAGEILLDRAMGLLQQHEQRMAERLGPTKHAQLLGLLQELLAESGPR